MNIEMVLKRSYFGLLVIFLVSNVHAECPHESAGLHRWSDANTWTANKPGVGDYVLIDKPILLDEPDLDLGNINIAAGGRLVFDPEVDIRLRVFNIYVYGALEIGSEECLHTGLVTIAVKGTRDDHASEVHPKVILVEEGGTLEIHGERKLSWTKITQTVRPPVPEDIFFEHKAEPTYESVDSWKRGLIAYTFTVVNNRPVVKQFGAYDLIRNGAAFASHMDNTEDGDIVMVTTQRFIRLEDSSTSQQHNAYDAVERLVYGDITNEGTLRQVSDDGETYGFIFQKGNPESFMETNRPLGEGCKVQFVWDDLLVFTAETGGGKNYYYQVDNFIVQTVDSAFPKINVIDDITTWQPGDTVVIVSTDYQWRQAEEREVIRCETCASNELRVNYPFRYTHFGEVIRGAIDMRAEVALISRNIVIEGVMEDTCPLGNGNCDERYVNGWDTFGVHIKILVGYASVHIEGAEVRFAGQQTDVGRYPIHFHMCLDPPTDNPPYIREVSIHHTFARCITIHASHGIKVIDTVCYDHMGHGYFLEDGGEKYNVFDGNLAIGTRKGTGKLEITDQSIPSSFWITNPNVVFKNNVAAGGDGTGVWIIFPDKPLGPSADLGLMDEFEARHTPITQLDNNVGHSNAKVGFDLSHRLDQDRNLQCCNHWQPKVDPKDPLSDNIEVEVTKITGYKNRDFNAWIEGGLLNVSHVSTADSLNGLMLTNDGMVFEVSGRLMKSAIIGHSENLGDPLPGNSRSYPAYYQMDSPQSGLTLWMGPIKADDIWLDGFEQNSVYDTGAIAIKRRSPYFQSIQTELRGIQFAFDDDNAEGTGNMNIAGVAGVDPGWREGDAKHAPGYTWYHDFGEGLKRYYVVKGDHFSAATPDCKLRTNWRLAVCETKYGNLRLDLRDTGDNNGVIFVRDSVPAAQQNFLMEFSIGPEVVLDGSDTYTVNFADASPGEIRFFAEGMEIGDVLRIGVCLPLNAEYEITTYHPYRIFANDRFVQVSSLAELDATDVNDGKKSYFDETTGMVYFKFVSLTTRGPDEPMSCSDSRCPNFQVAIKSGDRTNADCRQRLYGDAQHAVLSPLPTFDGVISANAASNPPSGWGAGITRPFNNRAVVHGGFSQWTPWSACTVSCAGGEQTRKRLCNDPMPANGGNSCDGLDLETQRCSEMDCPKVNGGFTEWTQWTLCTSSKSSGCQGYHLRSRDCLNPEPRDGGEYCTGTLQDMEPCTTC